MKLNLKAVSLFAGAGIGELYLNKIGICPVVANEIIKKRAAFYQHLYPDTEVIAGDIKDSSVKNKIVSRLSKDIKLLIATPPCQGLSTLGKNKKQFQLENDERNYLIYDIFEIIDKGFFDYIIIENVPRFIKMYFPFQDGYCLLEEVLRNKYAKYYHIDIGILNAKDYGVPQTRPRVVIKLYKKGLSWLWPEKEKEIPLQDSIGHLPSLESGEHSEIAWHYASKHNERAVQALSHTPSGKSALTNSKYYPKKENGDRIIGFHNTFKRMTWEHPAPARTTYCGSISSHNNVHPGRLMPGGTYSDARVLTMLETFIVSSIEPNTNFPPWASDTLIRTLIGEAIPPLMLMKILQEIKGAV